MNYFAALNLNLTDADTAGKLRRDALTSVEWSPSPTGEISYTAANRVLIIAAADVAARVEAKLPPPLLCYAAIPAADTAAGETENMYHCAELSLRGYLGKFVATFAGDKNLAEVFNIKSGCFDHVLDCGNIPLLRAELKPPGYHHARDAAAQDDALRAIAGLVGEFAKPKYFEYDAGICAHGRSGIKGCTRCIDACPADAIFSIGESIEVDAHLCQGGGACAGVCPSGAIRYAYPRAQEQVEVLRKVFAMLRREKLNAQVLIFDNERGRDAVAKAAAKLPAQIIPLAVEEIGSAGLDLIAPALAYGAAAVWLYAPPGTPEKITASIARNINVMQAVLKKTGHARRVEIIKHLDQITTAAEHEKNSAPVKIKTAATFAATGDKRATIRAAFLFFAESENFSDDFAKLPGDAMFGQVQLNVDACTLCMGCVSVCPAGALQAGGDSPALKLIEANCVQCGICAKACPERALNLDARFYFNQKFLTTPRALKQEEAMRCIRCDKPFATASMIARMREKLKGHWMFETEDAMRRLRMCEDCRVIDLLGGENGGGGPGGEKRLR